MTAEEPVTKRAITIEDLAAMRLVSDPRLSPDGERVAYVVTVMDTEADGYRSQIWVVPTGGGEPIRLTRGRNDAAPRWSPDGRLLAFVSKRGAGHAAGAGEGKDGDGGTGAGAKPQLWLLPTGGGEARQLTRAANGVSDPVWSPDGSRLAFVSRVGASDAEQGGDAAGGDDGPEEPRPGKGAGKSSDVKIITNLRYKADGIHHLLVDHGYRHLFVVDVSDSTEGPVEARQVTDGPWDDDAPAWSPDGRTLAFVSNRTPDREVNNLTDLWTVPVEGGEAHKLSETKGPCLAPAFSPDGASIAFLGHDNPEPYRWYANYDLWTVPATGGAAPRNLTFALDCSFVGGVTTDLRGDRSAQRPVWSPDGRAVWLSTIERGTSQIARVAIEADGNGTGALLAPVVAGERAVMHLDLSRDGGRLVFSAGDALSPGELFVCHADGSGEHRLTRHNEQLLAALELSHPERFVYEGDGGWEIDGWLMRPLGLAPGRRAPLILEIHGGPAAQYGWAFFHEFQLLAARGYGVLFTNPRGSTGRGAGFTVANRSRWGEEDFRDIMAGLDAAIARGDLGRDWIDPERLGVAGGSFGGFMTAWTVGHTDRFKAAVTMRCVSNLLSFFGTSDIGAFFVDMQFETEPWDDVQKLLRHSPISYVKEMRTPLLIMHSEQDFRCPIEQAEQLYISLKKLGRETEFIRFPDEGHELSRSGKPAHRAARLRHILRWFDRYLRPGEGEGADLAAASSTVATG